MSSKSDVYVTSGDTQRQLVPTATDCLRQLEQPSVGATMIETAKRTPLRASPARLTVGAIANILRTASSKV